MVVDRRLDQLFARTNSITSPLTLLSSVPIESPVEKWLCSRKTRSSGAKPCRLTRRANNSPACTCICNKSRSAKAISKGKGAASMWSTMLAASQSAVSGPK